MCRGSWMLLENVQSAKSASLCLRGKIRIYKVIYREPLLWHSEKVLQQKDKGGTGRSGATRLSGITAAFFQLDGPTADGLIKQVVLKQVEQVLGANKSSSLWIKTRTGKGAGLIWISATGVQCWRSGKRKKCAFVSGSEKWLDQVFPVWLELISWEAADKQEPALCSVTADDRSSESPWRRNERHKPLQKLKAAFYERPVGRNTNIWLHACSRLFLKGQCSYFHVNVLSFRSTEGQ